MANPQRALPAQAIVRPTDLGLPPAASTDLAVINGALQAATQRPGVRVLGPVTMLPSIPPGYAVALQAVRLDGDHWYSVDGGKIALSAKALELLATAAGISTVSSTRVDDRKTPYRVEFSVRVSVPRMDGRIIEIERNADMDLSRDDTPDSLAAKGSSGNAKMLAKARQFVARSTETKAFARCVRAALGITGQAPEARDAVYVIPSLIPHLDMSDPEIKRMVAAKQLGIVGEVYGARPASVVLREALVEDEPADPASDPTQVTGGPRGEVVDVAAAPVRALPAPVEDPNAWRDQVQTERVPARVAAHPDDVTPAPKTGPSFACARCGVALTEKLASYTDETFGAFLCSDHLPKTGGAR